MKPFKKCIGIATLCLFALSCNSDKPITQSIDTFSYRPKPIEVGYVNQMDNQPDIYNNRNKLINKIKGLDKWLDFTGNYDEKSDETDNTISADDKFGFNVQIVGSKKHIKEVDFTYYPDPSFGIAEQLQDLDIGQSIGGGKVSEMCAIEAAQTCFCAYPDIPLFILGYTIGR